ncbi:hypothetical protein HU200_050780 [Digitaria exilis]|uniref:Uncharacterized protein n=1 Tax=Digitaria exilis TaxID=1010633 RepID=A0A835ATZ7_9POAL|nr:hypothetical protein HU200_050780 [Digitaria exilis]
MLRLRSHLLPGGRWRAAWPLPAASPLLLHHLLYSYIASAAAAATESTSPFVVEDYLVSTCGLTRAQALRSSKYLTHLKCPSKPEAALAFFAQAGLDKADLAAAIARDPRFLCCKVDETLAPRVAQLCEIGFSPAQISRLIAIDTKIFARPAAISHLAFYLSYLGSYDRLHAVIKRYPYLLSQNVDSVVKPNIALLKQCGLSDCDIVKHFVTIPTMLLLEPERLKEIVAWADKLGVPRNSAMFQHALKAICCVRGRRVDDKLHLLKKILGCSEAEVCIAVGKLPSILTFAEDKLRHTVEFLKMEVGLNVAYILRRPALLCYGIKTRLMPRHYVLKVLKEEGLLKKDVDFYHLVSVTEKIFAERFLDPYREVAPGLADAYAAACAGQVPPVIQR